MINFELSNKWGPIIETFNPSRNANMDFIVKYDDGNLLFNENIILTSKFEVK